MIRLRILALGIISSILTALPVSAAQRVYINYGTLGVSFSVDSLETFAQQGKIDRQLSFVFNRLNSKQQTQLRAFLQTRYNLKPVIISRVSYSITGERLLKRFGLVIKTKAGQNGFYGIRAAIVQSAASPEGFTALNFLRKFPADIQIDIGEVLKFTRQISKLLKDTDTFVSQLGDQSITDKKINYDRLPDLRKPGNYNVSRRTINLHDSKRDRTIIVDLYVPAAFHKSQVPVITISNGLGGQRDRFILLAQHLASQGFLVVVPDHPGSSDLRQKQFFAGLYKENFDAEEYINRPLDITFVLNELEKLNSIEFDNKLDLQQVGMFGYSFGGTTALSLAGAELDFDQLEKDCTFPINVVNISILYQCRALELPRKRVDLQDNRIKAVFVFVPFTNSLFGKNGLSRVKIPIFWQATDEDIVTPFLLEQLPAFNRLTSQKYLVVSENLPHTRVTIQLMDKLLNTNRVASSEELRLVTQSYLEALTVGFFKFYIAQNTEYSKYLQPSYTQYITKEPYNLKFVKFSKSNNN